jgi:hypothetical protein
LRADYRGTFRRTRPELCTTHGREYGAAVILVP